MKFKSILIFSILILLVFSCRSVTNYERVANKGYKKTDTFQNYARENQIDLLESKDMVYFSNLSESDRKEIFPEYPEKPGAIKKFLYNFIKLDFDKGPVYYKLENDIFKKDDYIFLFVKSNGSRSDASEMYISIKNRSKDWFHMGAVDFKSGNKLVRISFEAKKLSGDSFWLDRTRLNLDTEEYVAFILEEDKLDELIKMLDSDSEVEVVLYSDYNNIKRTRNLTKKEREDMLQIYNFYKYEL